MRYSTACKVPEATVEEALAEIEANLRALGDITSRTPVNVQIAHGELLREKADWESALHVSLARQELGRDISLEPSLECSGL